MTMATGREKREITERKKRKGRREKTHMGGPLQSYVSLGESPARLRVVATGRSFGRCAVARTIPLFLRVCIIDVFAC